MTFFPDRLPPIFRNLMEVDGSDCILYAFQDLRGDKLNELEEFVESQSGVVIPDWLDGEVAPRCTVKLSDIRISLGAVYVCAFIIHEGDPEEAVNRQ